MITLETLETRIEHYVNVNELQHQSMVDKNDLQHKGLMDKLDMIHKDVVKDLIFYNERRKKIEEDVESLKEAKLYIIAIATIIAFLLPYLIQIGLATLK